jgi:integrase
MVVYSLVLSIYQQGGYQHAPHRTRDSIGQGRRQNHQAVRRRRATALDHTRWREALAPRLSLRRRAKGSPETLAALELLALTFVRPGELRSAEWAEFELDRAVGSIPAEKMKMRRPHRVPLAPRTLAILRDLHAINGKGRLLFPSVRSSARCMSENTVNAALRRLGFKTDEMTAHGFRSAASSILNECGLWNPDAIERQLAHVDNDSVRRAYARADFWEERVRMMAWWADKCEELRRGGVVVPLRA